MAEILTVTDLRRVYGKGAAATRALDGVSLSLEAGEFVGVMGPSGSGKTTLLNCVSTIDRPTAGSIVIDGRELTALRGKELARFRRERLGFIFQDCNLLDTLTAGENIALVLERRYPTWREDEKARRRAVAALQRLGYSFEQVRAVMGELDTE